MSPLAPLAVIERMARRLPLPLGLRLAERLGRAYVRAALATGCSLHPWDVKRFPEDLAGLLGESAPPGARRQLVEDRLVFVLTQWLVRRAIRSEPQAAATLLPGIEISGAEHLRAALGRGRGAVALSTHFGFPQLIRPALDRLAIPMVAGVATPRRAEHIAVEGDVWTRARGLQRIRGELAHNRVCVLLPDRGLGATMRVPFLAQSLDLGAGAFRVGDLGGSPIVPFFICAADRPARFRLDILPPLASAASPGSRTVESRMREFAGLYGEYVRRHPSHLPYRSAGGLASRPGEEADQPAHGAEGLE